MSCSGPTMNAYSQTVADLLVASFVAKIILEVGDVTYIATAACGSLSTAAVWAVCKIDASVVGLTVITWADGNCNFDNTPGLAGVNLPGLSYS